MARQALLPDRERKIDKGRWVKTVIGQAQRHFYQDFLREKKSENMQLAKELIRRFVCNYRWIDGSPFEAHFNVEKVVDDVIEGEIAPIVIGGGTPAKKLNPIVEVESKDSTYSKPVEIEELPKAEEVEVKEEAIKPPPKRKSKAKAKTVEKKKVEEVSEESEAA